MKIPSFFPFVLSAIIGLVVIVPLSSEAGPRRKNLGKCPECKKVVYSHYKVTGYKKSRPVYGWKTSGHQACAKKMAAANAKAEAEAKAAAEEAGAEEKNTALAKPLAYGGGSGYGRFGYSGGLHGHPRLYPAHRCRPGCGHGGGYGLGYGSGTVVRSVKETRATPSTLGLFGGFPGTATRTYTTRTRVSRRGGYGGFSGCR